MLNSAASMLVRQDTATSPEGRTDIADYESKQNGDVNNVTSRLASLNLTSGNNPAVKRPSVVLTDPSAKEAKGKPEEESVKMSTTRERPKRQLPVSPKSLYSTSQPANAQPQSNQESKLTSQQASATPSNRLSTLSTSSSRSSSDNSLTDKPASRQGLHNQTHIAVFKFVARHSDEIDLDEGDPISVSKMHEDLWYEGVNVRTGKTGIFPSRYVSDILHGSISKESLNSQHNQFFLRFLGSVEVGDFKGNEIICGAMKKIVKQHQLTSVSRPPQCTLEVSARGINIIEHLSQSAAQQSKRQSKRKIGKLFDKERPKHRDGANTSHFFTLKNVTFCGCHPTNARFFAFITKHPEEHRFACYVFMSEFSTEPVAFAVGQAFREFYAEFMDFQAPVEDFYIE